MNITTHGVNNREELNQEKFKCSNCGCEFTADYDEYYVKKGESFNGLNISGSIYSYSSNVTDVYVCSCPECHKIVVKEKSRLVTNPCVTLTGARSTSVQLTDIPDACKSCSNHPSNGGSGICNCTLGSEPVKC